jgi:hypothetical protein
MFFEEQGDALDQLDDFVDGCVLDPVEDVCLLGGQDFVIQDQEPGYSVSSHVFLNTRAVVAPTVVIVAGTAVEGKGVEENLV